MERCSCYINEMWGFVILSLSKDNEALREYIFLIRLRRAQADSIFHKIKAGEESPALSKHLLRTTYAKQSCLNPYRRRGGSEYC